MNIGDVFMRVIADLKGFTTSVNKEASVAGDKAGKTLTKSMGKSLSGNVKGGILQGLGIGAGLGTVNLVAQGLHTVVDGVFDTIHAASDLRESMSLTGQVFEGATGDMETWADGAASAFGESKREALDFASKFGTAFKNVGMSLDDTADKSKVMTRLAADLASAFNSTGDEAATALRSGLLGESEPLRRFGVFLSEAAVSAKAAAMGISRVGEKLSDGQKVAARYALIMEQTADSQGMFGRDSESLADAQKSAAAALENLSAEVGEKLLPVMVELAHAIKEDVIPAVEDVIPLVQDLFRDLSKEDAVSDQVGWLQKLGDGVIDLVDHLTVWDSFESQADGRRRRRQGTLDAETEGLLRTNLAAKTAGEGALGLGAAAKAGYGALGDAATDGADAATDAARRVITLNKEETRSFSDMVKDMEDEASDLIDQVYDPQIQHAELVADKVEAAELRKVLASKSATAAEKRDAADRLLSLSKSADETRLALLESGNLTAADTKAWLGKLQKQYDKSTGSARTKIGLLIDKIKDLAALSSPGLKIGVTASFGAAPIFNNKPRAKGGPVQRGVPYLVNEETRHSEIWVPSKSGGITTQAQAAQAVAAYVAPGSQQDARDMPAPVGDQHFNLTVVGDVRARDTGEVLSQMQRLRSIGGRGFNGVKR